MRTAGSEEQRGRRLRLGAALCGGVAVLLLLLGIGASLWPGGGKPPARRTMARLLPFREWGFGTDPKALVEAPVPVRPGDRVHFLIQRTPGAAYDRIQMVVYRRPFNRRGLVLRLETIPIPANMRKGMTRAPAPPVEAKTVTITLDAADLIKPDRPYMLRGAPGDGVTLLTQGRRTRYGFVEVTSSPSIEAKHW